ncbi:MAG: hypothetical protein JST35_05260 [Armatimonadetes bacterium]|nr:hypothetical protein [Armatimonadota bacterium]
MGMIALATCIGMPELDVDADILLEEFHRQGAEAEWVAWDDPTTNWSDFRAVILRSTWDYPERMHEFLPWLSRVKEATTVLNPVDLVTWNLDKRYLLDLEAKGIQIVPTAFFEGKVGEIPAEDIVIKPTVSCGSMNTKRFLPEQHEEAKAFAESLIGDWTLMVQPYVSSVEDGGEISVVCLAGQPSHAIMKMPRFADGHESVSLTTLTDDLREVAVKVLGAIDSEWLYARVDVMRWEDGSWVLSELELVEPSLFLSHARGATEVLVTDTLKRLRA